MAAINPNAKALKSATTNVDVSAATAPSSGQVLTATGASTATWQTPSGGGDMKVFLNPGVFKINGGSLGTTSTIPFIDFRDGQADDAYASCKVPSGATSISAIKIIYTRLNTGNLYLGFYSAGAAYSSGATVQTDSTAEATFAGGASDATIGLITVTSTAYNGITIAADTIFSFGIFRNAIDATDTYASSFRVLGVMIEFA